MWTHDYSCQTTEVQGKTYNAQTILEISISSLFDKQNQANFADIFDTTLTDIAKDNSNIFSVLTAGGEKIVLFENLSKYVTDNRDQFCKAIVNKLTGFSFEHIFHEKFDFYVISRTRKREMRNDKRETRNDK